MLRERVTTFVARLFEPSPRFEQFLRTRTAVLLASLMSVMAVVGAAVAVWQTEWIDALVRMALAVVLGAWVVTRTHRTHGGPPRPAG